MQTDEDLPASQCLSAGVQRLWSLALCRAGSVPRVCRRWHRITAHASMWPVLRLTPRDSSVVAWLRQRSPGLRHLILQVGCRLAAAVVAEQLHGLDLADRELQRTM